MSNECISYDVFNTNNNVSILEINSNEPEKYYQLQKIYELAIKYTSRYSGFEDIPDVGDTVDYKGIEGIVMQKKGNYLNTIQYIIKAKDPKSTAKSNSLSISDNNYTNVYLDLNKEKVPMSRTYSNLDEALSDCKQNPSCEYVSEQSVTNYYKVSLDPTQSSGPTQPPKWCSQYKDNYYCAGGENWVEENRLKNPISLNQDTVYTLRTDIDIENNMCNKVGLTYTISKSGFRPYTNMDQCFDRLEMDKDNPSKIQNIYGLNIYYNVKNTKIPTNNPTIENQLKELTGSYDINPDATVAFFKNYGWGEGVLGPDVNELCEGDACEDLHTLSDLNTVTQPTDMFTLKDAIVQRCWANTTPPPNVYPNDKNCKNWDEDDTILYDNIIGKYEGKYNITSWSGNNNNIDMYETGSEYSQEDVYNPNKYSTNTYDITSPIYQHTPKNFTFLLNRFKKRLFKDGTEITCDQIRDQLDSLLRVLKVLSEMIHVDKLYKMNTPAPNDISDDNIQSLKNEIAQQLNRLWSRPKWIASTEDQLMGFSKEFNTKIKQDKIQSLDKCTYMKGGMNNDLKPQTLKSWTSGLEDWADSKDNQEAGYGWKPYSSTPLQKKQSYKNANSKVNCGGWDGSVCDYEFKNSLIGIHEGTDPQMQNVCWTNGFRCQINNSGQGDNICNETQDDFNKIDPEYIGYFWDGIIWNKDNDHIFDVYSDAANPLFSKGNVEILQKDKISNLENDTTWFSAYDQLGLPKPPVNPNEQYLYNDNGKIIRNTGFPWGGNAYNGIRYDIPSDFDYLNGVANKEMHFGVGSVNDKFSRNNKESALKSIWPTEPKPFFSTPAPAPLTPNSTNSPHQPTGLYWYKDKGSKLKGDYAKLMKMERDRINKQRKDMYRHYHKTISSMSSYAGCDTYISDSTDALMREKLNMYGLIDTKPEKIISDGYIFGNPYILWKDDEMPDNVADNSSSQYEILDNTDFTGDGPTPGPGGELSSINECISACLDDKECNRVVWAPDTNNAMQCWKKYTDDAVTITNPNLPMKQAVNIRKDANGNNLFHISKEIFNANTTDISKGSDGMTGPFPETYYKDKKGGQCVGGCPLKDTLDNNALQSMGMNNAWVAPGRSQYVGGAFDGFLEDADGAGSLTSYFKYNKPHNVTYGRRGTEVSDGETMCNDPDFNLHMNSYSIPIKDSPKRVLPIAQTLRGWITKNYMNDIQDNTKGILENIGLGYSQKPVGYMNIINDDYEDEDKGKQSKFKFHNGDEIIMISDVVSTEKPEQFTKKTTFTLGLPTPGPTDQVKENYENENQVKPDTISQWSQFKDSIIFTSSVTPHPTLTAQLSKKQLDYIKFGLNPWFTGDGKLNDDKGKNVNPFTIDNGTYYNDHSSILNSTQPIEYQNVPITYNHNAITYDNTAKEFGKARSVPIWYNYTKSNYVYGNPILERTYTLSNSGTPNMIKNTSNIETINNGYPGVGSIMQIADASGINPNAQKTYNVIQLNANTPNNCQGGIYAGEYGNDTKTNSIIDWYNVKGNTTDKYSCADNMENIRDTFFDNGNTYGYTYTVANTPDPFTNRMIPYTQNYSVLDKHPSDDNKFYGDLNTSVYYVSPYEHSCDSAPSCPSVCCHGSCGTTPVWLSHMSTRYMTGGDKENPLDTTNDNDKNYGSRKYKLTSNFKNKYTTPINVIRGGYNAPWTDYANNKDPNFKNHYVGELSTDQDTRSLPRNYHPFWQSWDMNYFGLYEQDENISKHLNNRNGWNDNTITPEDKKNYYWPMGYYNTDGFNENTKLRTFKNRSISYNLFSNDQDWVSQSKPTNQPNTQEQDVYWTADRLQDTLGITVDKFYYTKLQNDLRKQVILTCNSPSESDIQNNTGVCKWKWDKEGNRDLNCVLKDDSLLDGDISGLNYYNNLHRYSIIKNDKQEQSGYITDELKTLSKKPSCSELEWFTNIQNNEILNQEKFKEYLYNSQLEGPDNPEDLKRYDYCSGGNLYSEFISLFPKPDCETFSETKMFNANIDIIIGIYISWYRWILSDFKCGTWVPLVKDGKMQVKKKVSQNPNTRDFVLYRNQDTLNAEYGYLKKDDGNCTIKNVLYPNSTPVPCDSLYKVTHTPSSFPSEMWYTDSDTNNKVSLLMNKVEYNKCSTTDDFCFYVTPSKIQRDQNVGTCNSLEFESFDTTDNCTSDRIVNNKNTLNFLNGDITSPDNDNTIFKNIKISGSNIDGNNNKINITNENGTIVYNIQNDTLSTVKNPDKNNSNEIVDFYLEMPHKWRFGDAVDGDVVGIVMDSTDDFHLKILTDDNTIVHLPENKVTYSNNIMFDYKADFLPSPINDNNKVMPEFYLYVKTPSGKQYLYLDTNDFKLDPTKRILFNNNTTYDDVTCDTQSGTVSYLKPTNVTRPSCETSFKYKLIQNNNNEWALGKECVCQGYTYDKVNNNCRKFNTTNPKIPQNIIDTCNTNNQDYKDNEQIVVLPNEPIAGLCNQVYGGNNTDNGNAGDNNYTCCVPTDTKNAVRNSCINLFPDHPPDSIKVINKTPTVGDCNNKLDGDYLDDGNKYFSDWTCCINTHNTDYLYQSFDNEVFNCNKDETLVNGQCVKYCESDENYNVSTGTCEKENTCKNGFSKDGSCYSCFPGYSLENRECKSMDITCEHGTGKSVPNGPNDCGSCDSIRYALQNVNGEKCNISTEVCYCRDTYIDYNEELTQLDDSITILQKDITDNFKRVQNIVLAIENDNWSLSSYEKKLKDTIKVIQDKYTMFHDMAQKIYNIIVYIHTLQGKDPQYKIDNKLTLIKKYYDEDVISEMEATVKNYSNKSQYVLHILDKKSHTVSNLKDMLNVISLQKQKQNMHPHIVFVIVLLCIVYILWTRLNVSKIQKTTLSITLVVISIIVFDLCI